MTKDEALKLALDALSAYLNATDSEQDVKAHELMAKAFFAIKQALEQPESEPVAWKHPDEWFFHTKRVLDWQPLYTSPPKRECKECLCNKQN